MLDGVRGRKRQNYYMYIFDIWPLSVTLTFEIRLYIFNSIHWLEMINISARLFKNPFMHIGVGWLSAVYVVFPAWTLPSHLQSRQEREVDKLINQLKRETIIHIFQDFISFVHHFQHKMSLSYSSEVIILDEM